MKYLCLAWEEEAVLNALTREEWSVLRRETLDYVDALRESGHLLASEALQSAGNGVALIAASSARTQIVSFATSHPEARARLSRLRRGVHRAI